MPANRDDRQQRLDAANALVAFISTCGRKFFAHEGRLARMEIDATGKFWWVDEYQGKRLCLSVAPYYRLHRGFGNGGTLRSLVLALYDHVRTGERLAGGGLGPWPDWYSAGDPWAYGADMVRVREKARELGITEDNHVRTNAEVD